MAVVCLPCGVFMLIKGREKIHISSGISCFLGFCFSSLYLLYGFVTPLGKSRNHVIDWIIFPAVVLGYSVATFFLVRKKLKIAIFIMSSFSLAVFLL